jgi:hypothetical protein
LEAGSVAVTDPPRFEHRVIFDFEVDFSNGGGLQGQQFRLDVDGDHISDEELAASLIRDMSLLMVSDVAFPWLYASCGRRSFARTTRDDDRTEPTSTARPHILST